MATRKEQTSYAPSLALKNALNSKGMNTDVMVDQVFYESNANTQHLVISQQGDDTYRVVTIVSGVSSFDFISKTDPLLVRMLTRRELEIEINNLNNIQESSWVLNGSIYTYTIIKDNVTYTATDTKLVDAMCKCYKKVVDSL